MYIHVVTNINYITGVASLFGDLLSHVQFMNIGQQARRQKFSEGGSFDTAGGLGAVQGSQKPLGIWCKILQSSNFHNFRKALFSIDFHQSLHQLGLDSRSLNKASTLSIIVFISFQRGVCTNPSTPPPLATGVVKTSQLSRNSCLSFCSHPTHFFLLTETST